MARFDRNSARLHHRLDVGRDGRTTDESGNWGCNHAIHAWTALPRIGFEIAGRLFERARHYKRHQPPPRTRETNLLLVNGTCLGHRPGH
jgi:hypothetical protein